MERKHLQETGKEIGMTADRATWYVWDGTVAERS